MGDPWYVPREKVTLWVVHGMCLGRRLLYEWSMICPHKSHTDVDHRLTPSAFRATCVHCRAIVIMDYAVTIYTTLYDGHSILL